MYHVHVHVIYILLYEMMLCLDSTQPGRGAPSGQGQGPTGEGQ